MELVESPTRERSIGELFGELATNTSTLVRQEVKLATTELGQKAAFVGHQALRIAVGALLGVVALTVVAAAIVVVLAAVIPLWSAALIVGGVLGIIAILVVRAGLSALASMDLKLAETLASLKEDKSWAIRQIQ